MVTKHAVFFRVGVRALQAWRSNHAEINAFLDICSPDGHAENPHTSGSDVSAHGFWRKNDCNNNRANARVDLAAFWGNRNTGIGTWITVASNSQTIEPGEVVEIGLRHVRIVMIPQLQ